MEKRSTKKGEETKCELQGLDSHFYYLLNWRQMQRRRKSEKKTR